MEAYKFETTVLENGMIKIPQLNKYKNQQIEIFILLKPQQKEKEQKISADEFLKKWTGFIPEIDTKTEKYNYLMEKYA